MKFWEDLLEGSLWVLWAIFIGIVGLFIFVGFVSVLFKWPLIVAAAVIVLALVIVGQAVHDPDK